MSGHNLNEQAFGVGCFHFGFQVAPPPEFTVRMFLAEVEKVLKSVPNADHVQINCDLEAYNEVLNLTGELPRLNEGAQAYPNLPDGRISFDLLIPSRLQQELASSPLLLTFTERFRIDIYYRYYSPVALIRPIDPTSRPDPSQAVIVVRELLSREFKRQQQPLINFQRIGPSPLHADFYLVASPASSRSAPWDFDLEISRIRGYDQYVFYFNDDLFPSEEEALETLLEDVLDELDLYYQIVQIEAEKIHAWERLSSLSWKLVSLQQQRGFKSTLIKTFRTSRTMNDAFVALAEFEGTATLKTNVLRTDYRATYGAGTSSYLQEMVDEKMEERAKYPTEQVNALLRLFETRRLSSLELVTLLVSAVSGGAFGALITALLTGS